MATGTNGIATINELVGAKGLDFPASFTDGQQCPTKDVIINMMGGNVPVTYDPDQLVKYSDVTKAAITREFIVYNWGTVPIYSIQFTLENAYYSETEVESMGGQSIAARGGYAYGAHGLPIIGSGSGYIQVVGPIIVNGGTWTSTGKINLSAVTDLANGTQPTSWNNSIGAYYFVSGQMKLKIDLNFP